jgi:molecular chaperone GrpE
LAKKNQTPAPDTPDIETENIQDTAAEDRDDATDASLPDREDEVAAAQAEAKRNWDLYLRERADLENARKRHQRDREEAIRFANDRLLKEIIPVLDNLERAVEHAEQSGDESQGLLEGVHMTINQFRKVLEDFGAKPINAVGSIFDPNQHQAMGQVESEEQPPNSVVSEFQKGYWLHDRLLRPSLVMVAKAPAATGKDADAASGKK